MTTSAIDKIVQGFYDDLNAGEIKANKTLATAYQRSIDAFDREAKKLATEVTANGLTLGDSYKSLRLAELTSQAGAAFSDLGLTTGLVLEESQTQAVALAEKHVQSVIQNSPTAIPRSFTTLPKGAITQLVGSLGDGSPLRSLMQSFAAGAATMANRILLESVALGLNPNETARRMNNELGLNLVRARTIARTETMRVYREASRRSMLANKESVKGWIWYSALDRRTCPVCWSMHGKTFSLRESMATHPNCRCVQVPETYTWKELGFDIEELPRDPRFALGEDQFIFLDDADKIKILGKGGFTAWDNKLVTLNDFVQDTYSPAWGYGRTTKSLRSMVGSENARALTAGKIPANLSPKNFVYNRPSFADPFNLQKIKLDDALTTGRIAKQTADDILSTLEQGKFIDPADMDEAVFQAINGPIIETDTLLTEALNTGALDTSQIDTYFNIISKPDVTLSEVEQVKDAVQKAIDANNHAVQLAFEQSKQELIQEIKLAKAYGNINEFSANQVIDLINKFDNTPANKDTIINSINHYKAKNAANNPINDFKQLIDEAYNLGVVDDAAYKIIQDDIAAGTIDHRSVKGFSDHYTKLVQQNKPITGSPLTYAPNDMAKLTDLVNQGKMSQFEWDNIYQEFYNGKFTPNSFAQYVDDLVIQKSKVTKSSAQLLDEFNKTHYPQAFKNQTIQNYKYKTINKEDMQKLIDNAPPAPAPKPGTKAYGKLPYKKHVNSLESLKSQGIIDQNFIDQIYDQYTKGYLKNADIEKIINNKLNNLHQTISSTSHAPDPRTFRHQWDSDGFRDRTRSYSPRSARGRGDDWYDDWARQSGANTTAIEKYTGSLYDELNLWLRKGMPDDAAWQAGGYRSYSAAQLEKYAKQIDKALTTAKAPEHMVVIRNSRAKSAYAPEWSNPQAGSIIWDNGYMSTSADTGWSGFNKCGDGPYGDGVAFQLVLSIPQGGSSLYIKPISGIPSEWEVMIPRGAKLEITEVEDFTDSCGYTAKRIFAKLLG